MITQALQLVGALLVLAGFAFVQFGVLSQRSYTYLWLNLVGSGILAILAALVAQWGFLLLEGVWAVVSLWSLANRMLERGARKLRHNRL